MTSLATQFPAAPFDWKPSMVTELAVSLVIFVRNGIGGGRDVLTITDPTVRGLWQSESNSVQSVRRAGNRTRAGRRDVDDRCVRAETTRHRGRRRVAGGRTAHRRLGNRREEIRLDGASARSANGGA